MDSHETECYKYVHYRRYYKYVNVIYLFNDNLATGGSLTGAILSCRVELWKYNARRIKNPTEMQKNEYTALLASNTELQERINSIEYSI